MNLQMAHNVVTVICRLLVTKKDEAAEDKLKEKEMERPLG